MSALSDVARIAEVSKATASRALSGRGYVSAEARDRVVSAAAAVGYVVSSAAASLSTGRTHNVGVIIPHINRWFFGEVLEGIEAALVRAGYDLTLYQLSAEPSERRRVFENLLVRKRVDAVVAVGLELTPLEVGMLHSLATPVAGIGGPVEGIASVSIDDVRAAQVVTQHLIDLGHERIAHIGGLQDAAMDVNVHSKRVRGYQRAMADAGFTPRVESSALSIPSGFAVGRALLENAAPRPTAIVAGSDEVAIGVILAARQLGIGVPEQLSVVGIDGHELAELFGLTTLTQDPRGQGSLAVDLVMSGLGDAAAPVSPVWHRQSAHLEVRTSTAAPALVS